LKYFIFSTRKR